ncbi:MAG: hypothetical protein H0X62_04025 [Bacteroidetes bacterium]|nr:hypothetical protein [Bacteroidota bacterium]
MKKIFFYLLCVFSFTVVSAQTVTDDYYDPSEPFEPAFNKPADDLNTSAFKPKPQIGFMTGASIGSFGGGHSFSSTFMAPYLTYALSPRMNFSAAAIIGNTNFHGGNDVNQRFSPNGFKSQSFMVGMEYKITEHLRVGGSIQMHQGPGGFGNNAFGSPMMGGPFSPGFSPFMGW